MRDYSTQKLLQESKHSLQEVSHQAYQEGVWLLSHILQISSSELYFKSNDCVSEQKAKSFFSLLDKRKQGWPLDYLLEEKFFRNKKFFIKKSVFIPRKETELIVDLVLDLKKDFIYGVDFGCGAGTLCLSLLEEKQGSQFFAIEINPLAIECLEKNSEAKNVQNRLQILRQDVSKLKIEDIKKVFNRQPNLIVANPPYIAPDDPELDKQVLAFESPLALFSNQKGLGHIYCWFKKAMELLSSNGIYIFEFGYNQSELVQDFLNSQSNLESYQIYKDEQGIDRIALCIKKK